MYKLAITENLVKNIESRDQTKVFHIKVSHDIYADIEAAHKSLGFPFAGRLFGRHLLVTDIGMTNSYEIFEATSYMTPYVAKPSTSLSVTDNFESADMLEVCFFYQERFNRRVGWVPPRNREEYIDWMNKFITALQQETAELRDSVPWKWWKHQPGDEQNAKVEVIDLFHFLIALAQTAGMSAKDLYEGYLQKNKVNHNRQDQGYNLPGFVSKEDDNKAIKV